MFNRATWDVVAATWEDWSCCALTTSAAGPYSSGVPAEPSPHCLAFTSLVDASCCTISTPCGTIFSCAGFNI
jgi:hypothetical protein